MSNTDLQQYNGAASFPTTGNVGTNADPLLLPTDGPLVTADSNAALQAPVNVSLRRFKDLLLGLRGAIVGDFAGAVRKTLASWEVDALGGATSTIPVGSAKVSGAHVSGTTVPTTSLPQGSIYEDTLCAGWARGYWDGANMVLVRGANVLSLTRNAMGDYTVVFNSVVTSPASAEVKLTMGINPSVVAHGFIGNEYAIADDGAGRVSVSFYTIDPNAGVLLDTSAISHFHLSIRAY